VTNVDVVVVSYNSAAHLRGCVEPLSRIDWVNVIVVDNGSSDGTLTTIDDLDVRPIAQDNVGFAGGCNTGWRAGKSAYALFLNPDAEISADSIRKLVDVLEAQQDAAIAAPRIVDSKGALNYSLRRFPRLRSTYAQALYLHKLAPTARWADEIVRAPDAYDRPGPQEWVSGACILVRRDVLDRVDGWDDRFFFYCEDIDLCRRVHALGYTVQYEPTAVVRHEGGGSAPRSAMLPHLAASRVRYARLHRSRLGALAERFGIALEAATRVLVGRGGGSVRVGHVRSLGVALMPGTRT
jgi:N-acetylglucosaminyl-diphospho-decaprenol L-rhamnosyltransferase